MNQIEVLLTCGHTLRLSLPVDESMTFRCHYDGWQSVVETFPREWRVVCLSCAYGRWCGQARERAETLADTHERKHPGHICYPVRDTVTADGRGKIFEETSREHLRLILSDGSLFSDDEPETLRFTT